MAPRPAYVHPSGLSPAEHETYSTWLDELDSHISRLGRGLRFGELVAFVRKRTPVDREAEIMSFFGSIPQQQSLGIGEFIAVLRLLAHARTCTTLTRDHIFIQTHPLVFTILPSKTNAFNPFLRESNTNSNPAGRLEGTAAIYLREAAARKKRVLPPTLINLPQSDQAASLSPVTPKANSRNPFRTQPTPDSPGQAFKESEHPVKKAQVPAAISDTARSPPLPPRPSSLPKQPPPKHVSQTYQRLDDGTQTPTHIKPLHVPAFGPTSLDIISSSLPQDSAVTSKALLVEAGPSRLHTNSGQKSSVNSRKAGENVVRLLGSTHIGIDSQPLRAEPTTRHSSSSEDLYLQKNQSDSSLSSLGGMLPRARRNTQSSAATSTVVSTTSRNLRRPEYTKEDEVDTIRDISAPLEIEKEGQTTHRGLAVKDSTPPMPPPPRRLANSHHQPESSTSRAQKMLFGSTPSTGHPGPYSATSIRSSPNKQRTNSLPHISHSRAASIAGSTSSQPSPGARHLKKGAQGLIRASSVSHKHMQLETLLSKSRDVSQEWLDKARAGMQGMQGVERQGLIAADEVTFTAKVSEESGPDSDNSDREDPDHSSKQDFWGEIERKKTEQEVGWARLE